MQKAVNYYEETDPKTGKRKHSWSSFQNHFRRVKNRSYIGRFHSYLQNQGTKIQKYREIDSFVYQSFGKARSEFLFIHDIDLKRWGLQKARELGDGSFIAR
jgi:hypothetical protein